MFRAYIHVPCTGCRYCTAECPQQINIPEFISVYNKFKVNGTWGIKSDLENIVTEGKPADCLQCGACMKHCPQSIQIPDLMGNVVDMVNSL
ncbi:MAG: 4Fe-4S dicluster domain-containing protein [Bacteroidales bacterium]|nr:4Fe-4S dicluster domain-containing protein [Bacteroidales bacterium]